MQSCRTFSEFIVQNMSSLLCKILDYIMAQFFISCQKCNMMHDLDEYSFINLLIVY